LKLNGGTKVSKESLLMNMKPQVAQSVSVLAGELRLFICVALAHLIVWRTLRRRSRENSARRKRFKLLSGSEATGCIRKQRLTLNDNMVNQEATSAGSNLHRFNSSLFSHSAGVRARVREAAIGACDEY